MKFTEKKALELIEQHGLAKGTLATWKKRDSIPDKYEGEIAEKWGLNENQQQQSLNMIRAVQTGKFNIASLCRLAKVEKSRLHDLLRGKAGMYEPEFLSLKRAVNTLRIEIKKVASLLDARTLTENSQKEFLKLINRTEITWYVVFDRNEALTNKLDGWKAGRRSYFPEEEKQAIKAALINFLTETSI